MTALRTTLMGMIQWGVLGKPLFFVSARERSRTIDVGIQL